MTIKYIRTCQECGLRQECNPPKDQSAPTNAFLNKKCKKCKSEGLDLGSNKDVDENLKSIPDPHESQEY